MYITQRRDKEKVPRELSDEPTSRKTKKQGGNAITHPQSLYKMWKGWDGISMCNGIFPCFLLLKSGV